MRLTKLTHACVRLEGEGGTLVIDPGAFSEDDAALGAGAILVTHEHPDHFDERQLRATMEADPATRLWTLRAVADRMGPAFPGRVHTVGDGDTFTVAGFEVQVHGELHAVIHPDIPRITNVGYLVNSSAGNAGSGGAQTAGGSVFHPGDALTVPEQAVDTLLVPVMAPWSKLSEVVDYIRELNPRRTYDVHDALLTDVARPVYHRSFTDLTGTDHQILEPGSSADL